jgi:hypothetical protein
MGGGRLFSVVLRLRGTKKCFKVGQELLKIVFPKSDPLNCDVSILAQNVKIYSL